MIRKGIRTGWVWAAAWMIASALLVFSFRNARALSVLATHEFAEGVAKISVMLLAASLAPLSVWMRQGLFLIALAAGGLGVVLVLVSRLRLEVPDRASPTRLFGWLRRALDGVGTKLELMRGGFGFFVVLALVMGMKASEAAAILCVQQAFGVELPLTSLPGVLGAVMLASLVLWFRPIWEPMRPAPTSSTCSWGFSPEPPWHWRWCST